MVEILTIHLKEQPVKKYVLFRHEFKTCVRYFHIIYQKKALKQLRKMIFNLPKKLLSFSRFQGFALPSFPLFLSVGHF